jgi:CheY-like chemotaxis protein
MLIENNLVDQKLINKMLGKLSCPVVIMNDEKEAKCFLTSQTIDLVLLSINGRQRNGFNFTQHLKEMEAKTGKYIPVIVLVTNAAKDHRETCFELGIDEYLPKPVFEDELIRAIEKFTGDLQGKDAVSKKVLLH